VPGDGGERGGRVDAALSALNGVVGDYLRARGNGLEIEMELRHAGATLPCEREALAAAHPRGMEKLCVLVHGLAANEAVWRYPGDPATSYGTLLQAAQGYAPCYVRYNSGLAVAANGALLAALLEALVANAPGPPRELVLVGHSMGGLVIREACQVAAARGDRWLAIARHAFYLGAPHLGAPLEKLGTWVTGALRAVGIGHLRLAADVLDLRSRGIRDLRSGSAAPLVAGVAHHAVAGTLTSDERHLLALLLGDALVRVPSATGQQGFFSQPSPRPSPSQGEGEQPRVAARLSPSQEEGEQPRVVAGQGRGSLFAAEKIRVFPGISHNVLAHHPAVHAHLAALCSGTGRHER
jgi:triacylglycerol lipase